MVTGDLLADPVAQIPATGGHESRRVTAFVPQAIGHLEFPPPLLTQYCAAETRGTPGSRVPCVGLARLEYEGALILREDKMHRVNRHFTFIFGIVRYGDIVGAHRRGTHHKDKDDKGQMF